MTMRRLHSYFRSSASYRVRIAFELKGLTYNTLPVNLVRGDQLAPDYRAINPAGLVPMLDDNGTVLTQSLAIIEYLDEVSPVPSLLPGSATDRARIRAIAMAIACEIHPLNNLRVLRYLTDRLDVSDEDKSAWYRHWVEEGLAAVEAMLATDSRTGAFCHGDAPTLADCCLVPQIFNARRFDCRLDHLPTLMRINAHCLGLDAFKRAAPDSQAA